MKANTTDSYRKIYSIRIGLEPGRAGQLAGGLTTVLVSVGEEEISLESNYSLKNGVLSGLAKIYKMGILDGLTEIDYEIIDTGTVKLLPGKKTKVVTVQEISDKYKSVFEQRNLKYKHIEPFRPENLKNWTPNTEPDVYMAFGLLEDYTDFKYCCGTGAQLLRDIGYKYDNENKKPDAILIDRTTSEYMIAEFKVKSSHFKSNHKKDEVDVLVVWQDDEAQRDLLPKYIVTLAEIARVAAIEIINRVE